MYGHPTSFPSIHLSHPFSLLSLFLLLSHNGNNHPNVTTIAINYCISSLSNCNLYNFNHHYHLNKFVVFMRLLIYSVTYIGLFKDIFCLTDVMINYVSFCQSDSTYCDYAFCDSILWDSAFCNFTFFDSAYCDSYALWFCSCDSVIYHPAFRILRFAIL